MRIDTTYSTTYTGNKLQSAKSAIKAVTTSEAEVMDYLESISNLNIAFVEKLKPYDMPIKTISEYRKVLKRVENAKSNNGEEMWLTKRDRLYYKNADEKEIGLITYCGIDDNSEIINRYLSNRLTPDYVEKYYDYLPREKSSYADAVRVLDFSLNNLDKEFGKYQGCVFRQGFMKEKMDSYVSTSQSPRKAARLHNSWANFSPETQYSVIRTNDGQKINDFQRKMGTIYANCEEEILIPHGRNYRKISPKDMDKELINARENFASELFAGAYGIISGEVKEYNGFTKEKLLNHVKVYDEI